MPRPITVHLLDQAADWNKDGIYTVDQKAYDVIEGNVVSGDNLGIVISSEIGKQKRKYPITAVATNPNYAVTFEIGKQKRKYPITAVATNRNYAVTFNDDATFEVRKFRADITVPSLMLEFIYSGEAFSIAATLNSGAEIVYTWEFGGTIYHDNGRRDRIYLGIRRHDLSRQRLCRSRKIRSHFVRRRNRRLLRTRKRHGKPDDKARNIDNRGIGNRNSRG